MNAYILLNPLAAKMTLLFDSLKHALSIISVCPVLPSAVGLFLLFMLYFSFALFEVLGEEVDFQQGVAKIFVGIYIPC